jgi:hypothetical protein
MIATATAAPPDPMKKRRHPQRSRCCSLAHHVTTWQVLFGMCSAHTFPPATRCQTVFRRGCCSRLPPQHHGHNRTPYVFGRAKRSRMCRRGTGGSESVGAESCAPHVTRHTSHVTGHTQCCQQPANRLEQRVTAAARVHRPLCDSIDISISISITAPPDQSPCPRPRRPVTQRPHPQLQRAFKTLSFITNVTHSTGAHRPLAAARGSRLCSQTRKARHVSLHPYVNS